MIKLNTYSFAIILLIGIYTHAAELTNPRLLQEIKARGGFVDKTVSSDEARLLSYVLEHSTPDTLANNLRQSLHLLDGNLYNLIQALILLSNLPLKEKVGTMLSEQLDLPLYQELRQAKGSEVQDGKYEQFMQMLNYSRASTQRQMERVADEQAQYAPLLSVDDLTSSNVNATSSTECDKE